MNRFITYVRAKRYKGWRILALLIIAVTILLHIMVSTMLDQFNTQTAQQNFDHATDMRLDAVRSQFEAYANMLYAGRALFLATNTVTRQDWTNFVDAQKLAERYPAVYAMGYISLIHRSQVQTLTGQLNANRLPSETTAVSINPATQDDTLAVLTYLAPETADQAKIGYDLHSSDARAKTLDMARDSGQPLATGPITLIVDPKDAPPGTLFVIPVYDSSATSLATVADRRAAIKGYVTLALRMQPLLDAVFAGNRGDMAVAIADDGHTIYQSGTTPSGKSLQRSVELTVAGQVWTFTFTAPASFELSTLSLVTPTIAIVSVLPFLATLGLTFYFVLRAYHPRPTLYQR